MYCRTNRKKKSKFFLLTAGKIITTKSFRAQLGDTTYIVKACIDKRRVLGETGNVRGGKGQRLPRISTPRVFGFRVLRVLIIEYKSRFPRGAKCRIGGKRDLRFTDRESCENQVVLYCSKNRKKSNRCLLEENRDKKIKCLYCNLHLLQEKSQQENSNWCFTTGKPR